MIAAVTIHHAYAENICRINPGKFAENDKNEEILKKSKEVHFRSGVIMQLNFSFGAVLKKFKSISMLKTIQYNVILVAIWLDY
jgi:hypothetical protein